MELALTEFGTFLGRSGERLVVKRHGKDPVEFPAREVSNILIFGKGVSLSADAILAAVEQGAGITLLRFSGEPYAELMPARALGRARLRREQLRACEDRRGVALCKAFVSGKLRNQMGNLRYFAKSRRSTDPAAHAGLYQAVERIGTLLEELAALKGDSPDTLRLPIMNCEARAAREYWSGLRLVLPYDIGFTARVRRGATDPFNVCLNYGYGILYARTWATALEVGLDPFAGFLHADEEGKPCLVFDLVEEFRPFVVDRPVVALFNRQWRPEFEDDGELAVETRQQLAQRVLDVLNARVPYKARETRTADVVKGAAREVASVVCGEGEHQPYLAEW